MVQLKRDCPPEYLEQLRKQMEELEQEFKYDKEYICDCMGWEPAGAQNGSSLAESAVGNGFTGERRPSCCLIVFFLSRRHLISKMKPIAFVVSWAADDQGRDAAGHNHNLWTCWQCQALD